MHAVYFKENAGFHEMLSILNKMLGKAPFSPFFKMIFVSHLITAKILFCYDFLTFIIDRRVEFC
jgi:hypothetical protein